MSSKFIPRLSDFNKQSIKEQIRILNSKVAATQSDGKIKNIKQAFSGAKKKGGGTQRSSGQRGS